MADDVNMLVTALGRTTLWLAAAGLIVAAMLRVARVRRPEVHRAGCLLVLLVGWTFLRLPVDVPWHDAPRADVAAATPEPEMPTSDAFDTPSAVGVPNSTSEPMVAPSPGGAGGFDPIAWNPDSATLDTPPSATAVGTDRLADSRRFNWPLALLVVWLGGMGLLVLAWLVGYLRFLQALAPRVAAGEVHVAEWRALLDAHGVRRPIALSVTGDYGPMLCRLPRGYELIVPEPLWNELDAAQRGAILRHELAHYRRGDLWKSLGMRVLALPHWFNPVSWWVVRRFDEAAEWACDRAAAGEASATDYARVLVRLGEGAPRTVYGSAARGQALAGRVRRVLAGQPEEDSTMKKTMLFAAALCLAAASVVQVNLVAREPRADQANNGPSDFGPAVEPSPGKAEDSDNPFGAPTADDQPDDADGEEAASPASRQPAEKMLEEAAKAYEATITAFEAETIAMPAVYEWSLRWMQAAARLADTPADRLAAVEDHLKRMRALEKKIKRLYEVGNKGGEAQQFYAARFYVAEAERLLAEAEAAVALGQPIPTGKPRAAEPTTTESQPIDLKIKIAGLRGQVAQATAQVAIAMAEFEKSRAVAEVERNATTQLDVKRTAAAVERAKAELSSYKEQLKLYEEKFKLMTGASADSSARGKPAPANPPADQRELLYAGRDFDAWADDLRFDLSPEQRTESIRALVAFGQHGQVKHAAEEILHAMRDYSVWIRDDSPEGKLKEAALNAFASLPPEVTRPLISAALKSDSANERLFAAHVRLIQWGDGDQWLIPLLKDPDLEVRAFAASNLLSRAAATPGVIDVMRETLQSDDTRIAGNTFYWIPTLLGQLDGDDAGRKNAVETLLALGEAAVAALERAQTTQQPMMIDLGGGVTRQRERAATMLKAIQSKQSADGVLKVIRDGEQPGPGEHERQ